MDGVHEGVQIDQGSMFCIRPNTRKTPKTNQANIQPS